MKGIDQKKIVANAQKAMAGMQAMVVARYVYHADSRVPVIGYLFDWESINSHRYGEWDALVIRTTQPTIAYENDENNLPQPLEAPAGCDILVPANFRLKGLLPLAQHPTHCIEVAIEPARLKKLANGNSLWEYELRSGKLAARAEVIQDPLARLMAAAKQSDSMRELGAKAKHRHMSADEVEAAMRDDSL